MSDNVLAKLVELFLVEKAVFGHDDIEERVFSLEESFEVVLKNHEEALVAKLGKCVVFALNSLAKRAQATEKRHQEGVSLGRLLQNPLLVEKTFGLVDLKSTLHVDCMEHHKVNHCEKVFKRSCLSLRLLPRVLREARIGLPRQAREELPRAKEILFIRSFFPNFVSLRRQLWLFEISLCFLEVRPRP